MSPQPTRWAKGSALPARTQRDCLARFVHRFTAEHRPAWAMALRPNGQAYQVQFASDADWLAHTLFAVTQDNRLDERVKHCESNPTWPNDPALRLIAS